ncbi:unsaturated chondroitin disaccharide hydrolase [Hungatella effluvii]|uniref:Unsaturated chondroitin disaccharide hydrolase n=1 Tax=Hungatella effluvii TaxID=1096246 RepID=A0A2V3Y8P1_9FIRM|nr:glycoside hydrolase family 88 protein [Hungatella effluvii]PXX44545.1 unsaturated chondroitin disaccharide hydrolase [Hungatella effluvii]
MEWFDQALLQCMEKVEKNIELIGEHFPHVSIGGVYNHEEPGFWTAGFWPGILWLRYLNTGDEKSVGLAGKLEKRLDQVMEEFENLHHDVGFMWLPTAVMHYKADGNLQSRLRGLKAASLLAGRFNPAGNFIRAWNDSIKPDSQGWAIIDCLMNLPLLYWASNETGDARFKNIAVRHSDTVLKHFMRQDCTFPHIVSFDPESGAKIENLAGQGKTPDSVWARGQSWALYGFAAGYRETGLEMYAETAKRTADKVVQLMGEDKVPCWDYCACGEERGAKDSSAAACAASGMLLLSDLLENEAEKKRYRDNALIILKGLYEEYTDFSDREQGILMKGTVSYPDRRHINVPIIYGDYFFIEALMRVRSGITVF